MQKKGNLCLEALKIAYFKGGDFYSIVLRKIKSYFSLEQIESYMYKLKIILMSFFIVSMLAFVSCTKDSGTESDSSTGSQTDSGGSSGSDSSDDSGDDSDTGGAVATELAANCSNHEESSDYTYTTSSASTITLSGTTITVSGSNVTVSGSAATITAAGTYILTGTLTNGQIIVNAQDEGVVKLVLNGASITNTTNAPIDIEAAGKAIVILADGTTNYLTDASTYVFASADVDEPNACLYSKTDLSIYGGGSLTVKGNYNDGIASKDGLIIKSGTITVTAVDDGIRGKDYLIIRDGTITVTATGNGLKSDNDEDTTKGYIYIESGTVKVTSGGDALTAETDVLVSDGVLTLTSGGGSSYTASTTLSKKAIKGVINTTIDGGTFTISSADDAVHSNKKIAIYGGTFTISSGDDGVHADSILYIYGGTINITKCYEGIESAYIVIDDGTISVVASDDGINGAGGNDSSSSGTFVTTGSYYLYINGGYIYVYATGDGIDVNGSITMTGGTVLVNGPTNAANGALDYDSSFKISGGTLVAAGSSGMAQAPSSTSSQYSVLVTFRSVISANTLFHIEASDGTEIVTFAPKKQYQTVAFSSSKLTKGTTYKVYYGGSYSGTNTNGLYSSGTYAAGTQYASFTVSSITTSVN